MTADIAAARAYARKRLSEELPPELRYHAFAHTDQVVVPAVLALAEAAGVDDGSRDLLEVAAWFHDIGYIERYSKNEVIAIDIVAHVLPTLGFAPDDVTAIEGMIRATELPQNPQTPLEELLVDADLDALGRPDFWELQEALRLEQPIMGRDVGPDDWVDEQIDFLSSHHYFTDVARQRNDAAKGRHLEQLREQRARLGPPS